MENQIEIKEESKIEFTPNQLEGFLFWFDKLRHESLTETSSLYTHYGAWTRKVENKHYFLSAIDIYQLFKDEIKSI